MHTTSEEIWKPIPGYEGYYEASTYGRIRSVTRVVADIRLGQKRIKGRIKKLTDAHDGRMVVNLCINGKRNIVKVHRVVMLTFVGPRPEGTEICHKDGNYRNNRLDNLRYDTSSSNNYDMVQHGTHFFAKRNCCSRQHKYVPETLVIIYRKDGRFKQRLCRACDRARRHVMKHPEERYRIDELADAQYLKLTQGQE